MTPWAIVVAAIVRLSFSGQHSGLRVNNTRDGVLILTSIFFVSVRYGRRFARETMDAKRGLRELRQLGPGTRALFRGHGRVPGRYRGSGCRAFYRH